MKKSVAAVVSFLVAILMAAALLVSTSREEVAMVKVIQVKNDVLPSTVLLEDSLKIISIPQTNLTEDMITSADEAKGKIAKSFIGKDSFLYKYQIDSAINILGLNKGEVPLRIKTDIVTLGGARPGDYVDVLIVKPKLLPPGQEQDKKKTEYESHVVLSNVRVISHVLSNGSTRTLVRNQLYGQEKVVEVKAENVTMPPMEVEKLDAPAAVDIAVTPEQAMQIDKEVAEKSIIKLRVNPWPQWNKQAQSTQQTKPSLPNQQTQPANQTN